MSEDSLLSKNVTLYLSALLVTVTAAWTFHVLSSEKKLQRKKQQIKFKSVV
jgi:hypothetical protein